MMHHVTACKWKCSLKRSCECSFSEWTTHPKPPCTVKRSMESNWNCSSSESVTRSDFPCTVKSFMESNWECSFSDSSIHSGPPCTVLCQVASKSIKMFQIYTRTSQLHHLFLLLFSSENKCLKDCFVCHSPLASPVLAFVPRPCNHSPSSHVDFWFPSTWSYWQEDDALDFRMPFAVIYKKQLGVFARWVSHPTEPTLHLALSGGSKSTKMSRFHAMGSQVHHLHDFF